MKRHFSIPHFITVLPLIISCGDFSTSFEEITQDRLRTIDFIFRNCADTLLCEAAPGDSMEVTAIFAGEKVRDIDLSMSFDVRTSLYGKTESFGLAPLDYSIRRSTLTDTGTIDGDTLSITFKIPDDVLTTSTFLPERDWITTLPPELQPLIPASFAALSKSEVVSLLEHYTRSPAESDSIAREATVDSLRLSLSELFPGGVETLLQLFSAQIEITALVNNTYTIVSYATVRFHRLIGRIDSTIVCNRNPVVTRMGIYRVFRNNLTSFDPAIHSQPYEEIVLYDAVTATKHSDDTLTVRKDESYFLFVESNQPQMTRSITGAPIPETRRCEWFFSQYIGAADSVDAAQRMSITNAADGPVVSLIPASSESVSRCGLWVQVREEAIGPRLYPTGSTVFHTNLFFHYTSAYLNK